MEILPYLLKLSAYWLVMYLCYALLLRQQTFLRWNRAYLLGSLALGFVLPLVIYPEAAPPLPVVYQVVASDFVVTAAAPSPSVLTWENALWAVYVLGALLMLGRLLRHFHQLFSFIKQGDGIEMEGHTLVLPGDASLDDEADKNALGSFSFLRWVFISQADYESNFDTILNHELVHVRQRHSWDIIFLEILQVVFWFNPVLIIYKKALQQVHEYLADEQAKIENRDSYAEFLVSYALNAPCAVLTNQFFNHKLLKNRIAMLYKNKNSNWSLGKYAAVALFIGCTSLFVASCEREITPSAANGDEMVKGNVALEGIVTGPDGKPLEGVFIGSADSKKGTTTNAAGQFKLKAAPGADLQIAYPGFSGINFKVSPKYAKANLSVAMKPGTGSGGNISVISSPTADGKAVNVTIQSQSIGGEQVFMVVEQSPQFPGGTQELFKYLGENIKYPEAAVKANVSGKVFVNFVVTATGEITDIQILKGLGFGADAEAVRVMKSMPRWEPGMQSGKAVNVRYNLPIAFELEGGKEVGQIAPPPPPRELVQFTSADKSAFQLPAGPTEPIIMLDGKEVKNDNPRPVFKSGLIKGLVYRTGDDAARLYGDKGANGVIELSTTKK